MTCTLCSLGNMRLLKWCVCPISGKVMIGCIWHIYNRIVMFRLSRSCYVNDRNSIRVLWNIFYSFGHHMLYFLHSSNLFVITEDQFVCFL